MPENWLVRGDGSRKDCAFERKVGSATRDWPTTRRWMTPGRGAALAPGRPNATSPGESLGLVPACGLDASLHCCRGIGGLARRGACIHSAVAECDQPGHRAAGAGRSGAGGRGEQGTRGLESASSLRGGAQPILGGGLPGGHWGAFRLSLQARHCPFGAGSLQRVERGQSRRPTIPGDMSSPSSLPRPVRANGWNAERGDTRQAAAAKPTARRAGNALRGLRAEGERSRNCGVTAAEQGGGARRPGQCLAPFEVTR